MMITMTYVQKWKYGYRVRKLIPVQARPAFGGKVVFLQTLKTKDPAEANRRAIPVLARLQELIDQALRGKQVWTPDRLNFFCKRFEFITDLLTKSRFRGHAFDSRQRFEDELDWFIRENLWAITETNPLQEKPPELCQLDRDTFRTYIEQQHRGQLWPGQPGSAPAETRSTRSR
jgi:uncharacterized protein DUF6538